MNYLLKNNSKQKNKNKRLKLMTLVFIFGIFFLISFTDVFRGSLNKITLPFWKFDSYMVQQFSNFFPIIKSKKMLILENRKLVQELDKIASDLSIQKIIQKENEDLKSLLGRGEKKDVVLGAVLVKPSISPFDVIIIDVGVNKGIKAGNKVLHNNGSISIGEVEEVYGESSKVRMHSSPGEKFPVLVGDNSVQAEAEGLGGGSFLVKLPRGVEVKEGDAAVVPSITTSVFGFVQKIELNPTDSFQNIFFKIPVNLSELKWVLVEISE